MTKQSNPGRGGGRNSGKGGRGKGLFYKKNNKSGTKKSLNEKKYMFTLVANTKDVRVSTYNTTLKRVHEYLMTTIKERPVNVIDRIRLGKLITFPEPKIKVLDEYVAKPDKDAAVAARRKQRSKVRTRRFRLTLQMSYRSEGIDRIY